MQVGCGCRGRGMHWEVEMNVKLYGMAGSPNVRGAMLGLAEKGVDFELVTLMPPAWKTPEHLARNPSARCRYSATTA